MWVKWSGYFLFNLDISYGSLRSVVIRWYFGMIKKSENKIGGCKKSYYFCTE
jgi:hypothetical protein